MPTMADNNVQLACRSYNPRLMDKYIQDVWQLQVLCKCLLFIIVITLAPIVIAAILVLGSRGWGWGRWIQ